MKITKTLFEEFEDIIIMMKSIILFVVLISCSGNTLEHTNSKSVSVNSKEFEKENYIKIFNEKNKCQDLEFLNLDDMALKNIKNDIIRSDAINHISLHNNYLKKIPHNILDQVPHLTCLNLSRNNINIYENNLIWHPSLRVLDFSYQKVLEMNSIPAEPEIFEEIETFNEQAYNKYNHLVFNSSNMKLPNLEYLSLSGNDISAFLWEFQLSFPKLFRLDLINVYGESLEPNFFKKIPTTVRILHLENNYFRNLTLRNLTEITALYLDGNPFEKLEIISTTLKILSLSNCTSLFQLNGIFNTPYLQELDLSRNNFDDQFGIHDFYLPSLRILLLDHNKFSNVPVLRNVQQLNELSLRYNIIKYIKPNSYANLKSLTKLSLKGNKIDRLEKETFLGLQKLEYLDISENKLSYLPPDWTLPLEKLRYLNVNSNQFASISEMGIYSTHLLQYLFVRNNTFIKISTLEMEPLPDCITIYLA